MRTNNIIFEGKGYQINRENRCCVDGETMGLTRHHIVPSCYISKLDKKIKEKLKSEHNYYYEWDYCCICKRCHTKYEKDFGDDLHKLIWNNFEVDLKQTSYRNQHSSNPKPSEVVMGKIVTKEDYLKLRNMCISFFKDKMNPKFDLL